MAGSFSGTSRAREKDGKYAEHRESQSYTRTHRQHIPHYSVLAAQKEQETVPPAPMPEQILSAQTAFISYTGINSHLIESYIADHTGRPNGLYDEFYAAIKNWGRYSLVSSPADADLV